MEVRRAITLRRGVRVSRKKHKQVSGVLAYNMFWWEEATPYTLNLAKFPFGFSLEGFSMTIHSSYYWHLNKVFCLFVYHPQSLSPNQSKWSQVFWELPRRKLPRNPVFLSHTTFFTSQLLKSPLYMNGQGFLFCVTIRCF